MRTSNFRKGRRAAGFFRLGIYILIALTMAMGGMALNTQPVQAANVVPAAVNNLALVECVPWAQQFNVTPACPGSAIFFWPVGVVPAWAHVDPLTGELTCCPGAGTSGGPVFNFTILCTEMQFPLCWPVVFFAIPVSLQVTVPAPTPPGTPPNCTLTINPTFYPVAWENVPFTMTLTATGNVGTLNWSATSLPAGLTLNPATGVISGTPTPGTCGFHNVTATVTDTGVCNDPTCCPPTVNRPFTLIVDCLANYAFTTYYTTACDFTVAIGSGLTQGLTQVLIDGSPETMLGGGQSAAFTSVPCQSHLVTVDQVIPGSDPKTRLAVTGTNQKMVTDIDNYAYFDYQKEVLIETGSEPAGISQPPGTGFYTIGSAFSTTTPSPVQAAGQEGIKYIFKEFRLPDGSTNPNRDLSFTVNTAGQVKAEYDTYYLLQLNSEYPPVNDSSWHLKDSAATWDLALPAVPLQGLMGFLGGQLIPVNARGTHPMTGPYTQEIMWRPNYTWPIIAIVLILLVIGGLCYFVYRFKAGPTRPATTKKEAPPPKSRRQPKAKASRQTTRTGAKKAVSKTKPKAK